MKQDFLSKQEFAMRMKYTLREKGVMVNKDEIVPYIDAFLETLRKVMSEGIGFMARGFFTFEARERSNTYHFKSKDQGKPYLAPFCKFHKEFKAAVKRGQVEEEVE